MAKRKKSKAEKAKVKNPYFEGIRDGLLEAGEFLEKGKPLTCRRVLLKESPKRKRG